MPNRNLVLSYDEKVSRKISSIPQSVSCDKFLTIEIDDVFVIVNKTLVGPCDIVINETANFLSRNLFLKKFGNCNMYSKS